MKIRHILLTSDLTDEGFDAFAPAFELARELGARVTLLHVVDDGFIPPPGATIAPAMAPPNLTTLVKDAEHALARLVERTPDDLDVAGVVVAGDSASRLVCEYAATHDVDLIALSTHGRSGFRRLALGSVAEEILRKSSVPVLSFHRS